MHTTTESAVSLASLIARKPTLSRLSLGEVSYDSGKTTELDVPVASAAVMTWGGDLAANRKAHTGKGWCCKIVMRLCTRTDHKPTRTISGIE